MKYKHNMIREEELLLEIDTLKTDLEYAQSDLYDLKQENIYLRRELDRIRGKLAVIVEDIEEIPYVSN